MKVWLHLRKAPGHVKKNEGNIKGVIACNLIEFIKEKQISHQVIVGMDANADADGPLSLVGKIKLDCSLRNMVTTQ